MNGEKSSLITFLKIIIGVLLILFWLLYGIKHLEPYSYYTIGGDLTSKGEGVLISLISIFFCSIILLLLSLYPRGNLSGTHNTKKRKE